MAKRKKNLSIKENVEIGKNIYRLILTGDDFTDLNYGQFVNIKLGNLPLRRPFSICDFTQNELTLYYKIVGEGTEFLKDITSGQRLECFYPLGTGFKLPADKYKTIGIIGGGIGVAPLLGWYKYLKSLDTYDLSVVLGFRTREEEILSAEFGYPLIAYDSPDGRVTEFLTMNNLKFDYIYCCGSEKLLEKLALFYSYGETLLESKIACGIGACLSCSRKTSDKSFKRVCTEGPRFSLKEVRSGLTY